MNLFEKLNSDINESSIAVETPESLVTYKELFAFSLIDKSIQSLLSCSRGSICVCMSHSRLYIETILFILSINKRLIPINPSASLSECEHIFNETQPSYLISDRPYESLQNQLCHHSGTLYVYDMNNKATVLDDSCLIIFTSGTTSKPKGVRISSESLFANISAVSNNLLLTSTDKTIIFSPPAYAMAFTQILSFIYSSARILPYAYGLKFPSHLLEYCRTAELTGITFSLSLLKLLDSQLDNLPELPTVRYISSGGMSVYGKDLRLYKRLCPNASIINFYGCTENSPRIAHYWVPESLSTASNSLIPVGKAIEGVKVKILPLDSKNNKGEILVSGTSLSSGYLNNSELTSARFINGWYHTGDLGYIINDQLYVTGRLDNVFSVSHEKLEPEEVEAIINTSSIVSESVVIPYPDKILMNIPIALITISSSFDAQSTESIVSEIRRFVVSSLSSYKVPSSFFLVPSIPKTTYGKLDRKAAKALALSKMHQSCLDR